MRELPFDLRFTVGEHRRPPRPRLAAQGQRVPLRGQAGAACTSGSPRAETRPGARLRPHPQAVGARVRRRAVRQLRLGRQAQGRRPARRVRDPATPTRGACEVTIERVAYDAEAVAARGRRGRAAGRVRRQAAGRRVTRTARPAAARRVPRQRAPRRAGDRLGHRRRSSSPSDTGLQLLENAAATAAGLFAIILMFGPVSGGALQPGRLARRRRASAGISRRDALAYIPAQIAGCITRRGRRQRACSR